MKITEITHKPTPPPRTFTLELTENELKLLGLIVGSCDPNEIKASIETKNWRSDNFPGVEWDNEFIHPLYDLLVTVIRNKH